MPCSEPPVSLDVCLDPLECKLVNAPLTQNVGGFRVRPFSVPFCWSPSLFGFLNELLVTPLSLPSPTSITSTS